MSKSINHLYVVDASPLPAAGAALDRLAHGAEKVALAELKMRRMALGERLATLNATRERLSAAEGDEADALAAVGEVGRAELAAMTGWAAAGANGEPPAIDPAARTAATQRLAIAQAKAVAARGASADIDGQIAAVAREMASLGPEIERAALTMLSGEFEVMRGGIAADAANLRLRVASAFGLVQTFRELADGHRTAGRMAEAAGVVAIITGLGDASPDVAPSFDDVHRAEPAWAARLQELTR